MDGDLLTHRAGLQASRAKTAEPIDPSPQGKDSREDRCAGQTRDKEDKSSLRLAKKFLGLPGGLVVKNLPSSAGDLGSLPCWETEITHTPQIS